MSTTCDVCDGSCEGVPLDRLAAAELRWLWDQLADAGDRRGDRSLTSGTVGILIPTSVDERAAAVGLLGRGLTPGVKRRVNLADLAGRLAPFTPGAVAAHATGRHLAESAAARARRAGAERDLRALLDAAVPGVDEDAWAALRRSGWISRLVDGDAPALVARAEAVIARLPGGAGPTIDRRLVAHDATGDPHDLDSGRAVAGLTLALLVATGRVEAGLTPRDAWAAVGVAYDDITGGLTVIGIAPTGWYVPAGAPLTLPPRVLADCNWPAGTDAVFVTENPSVLSAAAEIADARVICTSGTPSRVEVAAVARLAERGWRLKVRADFDDAGLNHVRALLEATPSATPWHMGVDDYRAGVARAETTVKLRVERLPSTPWDASLAPAMAAEGVAVFEECFIDELVADIAESAGTAG